MYLEGRSSQVKEKSKEERPSQSSVLILHSDIRWNRQNVNKHEQQQSHLAVGSLSWPVLEKRVIDARSRFAKKLIAHEYACETPEVEEAIETAKQTSPPASTRIKRLKQMYAELSLDHLMLKEVPSSVKGPLAGC